MQQIDGIGTKKLCTPELISRPAESCVVRRIPAGLISRASFCPFLFLFLPVSHTRSPPRSPSCSFSPAAPPRPPLCTWFLKLPHFPIPTAGDQPAPKPWIFSGSAGRQQEGSGQRGLFCSPAPPPDTCLFGEALHSLYLSRGGGTVCFISPQPRPSPPDKGLQVGGGPEKLLATDNSLCCQPSAQRAGRGRERL